MTNSTSSRLSLSICAVGIFAVCAHADVIYRITVDTSSISNQSGYIDLEFNPANTPQNALASFGNYAGLLLDSGTISTTPSASGDLELGTATVANNIGGTLSGYNDYNEETLLTFGDSTTFDVAFSGPELSNPSGNQGVTTFALAFYASDDATPLLVSDPNVNPAVLEITINLDGSTTEVSNIGDAADATLVNPPNAPTSAPEPGTFFYIVLFTPVAVLMAKLRRRSC